MLIPDVNVLVNAENLDSTDHPAARDWLLAAANTHEGVAVPEMVLLGFARVITGRGLGPSAATPAEAFAVCEAIQSMPAYFKLGEGRNHWKIFRRLVTETGISGRHLTDAYLAAFAIENDATFVTFDRGFARFPGLRLLVPT